MDSLTLEQRRRCMSAVRNMNTRPELIVRKYRFARGFRYRLNCKQLPGYLDIVLNKYRAAIFVNGAPQQSPFPRPAAPQNYKIPQILHSK